MNRLKSLLSRMLGSSASQNADSIDLNHPWNVTLPAVATNADIFYCFRLLLGRTPSQIEWPGHSLLTGSDLPLVVSSYLQSREFRERNLLQASLGNIQEVQIDGFRIYASYDDVIIGRQLIDTKCYEPEIAAIFRSRLKPGMNIIDVGANIGFFSLLSASIIGPYGLVYSFEPNSNNAKMLYASRRINGFENIVIVQAAAGRKIDQLAYASAYSNGSVSELQEDNIARLLSTEFVASIPVDQVVPRDIQIGLVKIDVEGYEFKALSGAIETIRTHHPLIVSEFSPPALQHASGVSGEDYLRFLLSLRYRLSPISLDGAFKWVESPQELPTILDSFAASGTDHIDVLAEPRG